MIIHLNHAIVVTEELFAVLLGVCLLYDLLGCE
jgi:hypothetical protein